VRIALFTCTYHPTLNGVANCVSAYRSGLKSRGHEVTVFAPAPQDYDLAADPPDVIRFPAVPAPGEWDYDIAIPISKPVMDALRQEQYDIVHTQHPFWVGAWGDWYARWSNIPLVTTVHTQYTLFSKLVPLPSALVDAYIVSRVASYCNSCQMVTTPVKSARRRLRSEGVVAPIKIVPNPIDLSELPTPEPERIRAAYGIDPDTFLMGFVGRLAPEKNLELVLEAAAMVVKRLPQSKFLMVGAGSELQALQSKAADLGIHDRVIFAGRVEHQEVAHYQAALDALLTASMSETQPLSYTEAMAVGTPVVAVQAPGSEDMIESGETGLLSAPEAGARGLAEQTLLLATDLPLRDRIIAAARQHVKSYDIEVVIDRLLDVYDRARERYEESPKPKRKLRRRRKRPDKL
jgi:glycosyltransferase involved in cell wall biosynthesis